MHEIVESLCSHATAHTSTRTSRVLRIPLLHPAPHHLAVGDEGGVQQAGQEEGHRAVGVVACSLLFGRRHRLCVLCRR